MTSASATNSAALRACQAVEAFFDAYRARDVEAMVNACSEDAEFHHEPFALRGAQRARSGDGTVHDIGKLLWLRLIECFPDLTNTVTSIRGDDMGNVAAEVTIGGTRPVLRGAIDTQGERFAVPHLFLFRVSPGGLIEMISACAESAEMYQQLRRIELD